MYKNEKKRFFAHFSLLFIPLESIQLVEYHIKFMEDYSIGEIMPINL